MASRKNIQGIVSSFAHWFVSRNNDIDGYWGVGKIYLYSCEQNAAVADIDILAAKSLFSEYYRNKLVELSNKHRVPISWIDSAKISVKFSMTGSLSGSNFEARLIITSDLGKEYTAFSKGFCRPHNPNRERRRWIYGMPTPR